MPQTYFENQESTKKMIFAISLIILLGIGVFFFVGKFSKEKEPLNFSPSDSFETKKTEMLERVSRENSLSESEKTIILKELGPDTAVNYHLSNEEQIQILKALNKN